MPIEFKSVDFTYSPHSPFEYEALKDINLVIDGHGFSAIVGHTGSGKSTLVQMINGLLLPSFGAVAVDEEVIVPEKKKKYERRLIKDKGASIRTKVLLEFIKTKQEYELKSIRKKVGIVFQFPEYQLFEETVEKDVAFGPLNFGFSKEEAMNKAHIALEKVGLDKSYFLRSPFELSGGERRRVAIAGIIATEPDILILDEPTAGLDPQGAKAMMDLFLSIYQKGTGIIMVTHDMDIVLRYAQEVIVMKEGRIVERSTPIELFGQDNEDFSLEIPMLYQVAKKMIMAGYPIDIRSLKSEDDLAKMIAKGRK